jgi:putative transposase
MPNHVHLLVTPPTEDAVSGMMKALGERYVRAFNKAHKRSGTLWEGRFKSSIVESHSYLFICYRYIELNPVRAGLAAHPGEYPWSSYLANAEGAASQLISPHPAYLAIADDPLQRRQRYREMVERGVSYEDLEAIRAAVCGGFALGTAVHHGLVESHTGMRSQRVRRQAGTRAEGKPVPE